MDPYLPIYRLLLFSFSLWALPPLLAGQQQALFFAVDEYWHLEQQEEPRAIWDAAALGAVLSSRFDFQVELVENPTTEDIREKLGEYRRLFEGNHNLNYGQLLIYFIGRGAEENGAGYFLPADAESDEPGSTGISWDSLLLEIAGIDCKHILVVADVEYSAAIQPSGSGVIRLNSRRPLPSGVNPGSLEGRRGYATRMMLSLDTQYKRDNSGASLSQLFREGLEYAAEQASHATIEEVKAYIKRNAGEVVATKGFEGDNEYSTFVFYSQSAAPAELEPGEDDESLWQLVKQKGIFEGFSFYVHLYPDGEYAAEAARQMKRFSSTLVTADGRAWEVKQGPAYGKNDGYVLVTGGTFTPRGIKRAGESLDSDPPEITVREFYMSPDEVAYEEYEMFCRLTSRDAPDNPYWMHRGGPVVEADWYDAVEYCNWLSRQNGLEEVYSIQKRSVDGENVNRGDDKKWRVVADWKANGYRLPTVAEWEYAACTRSGYGSEAYGLKIGEEVMEWCWDWETFGYYGPSRQLQNPRGPEKGAFRALRSKVVNRRPCGHPDAGIPTLKHSGVGFRVARNAW